MCGFAISARSIEMDRAATDVAQSFREALLDAAVQGVVVLRGGDAERHYFGEGRVLYESCMDSPHAGKVIRAIDDLAEEGAPFTLTLHTYEGNLGVARHASRWPGGALYQSRGRGRQS